MQMSSMQILTILMEPVENYFLNYVLNMVSITNTYLNYSDRLMLLEERLQCVNL